MIEIKVQSDTITSAPARQSAGQQRHLPRRRQVSGAGAAGLKNYALPGKLSGHPDR